MITLQTDLTPEQYFTPELMRHAVAKKAGIAPTDIADITVLRAAIDCRGRKVCYHTSLSVRFNGEPPLPHPEPYATYTDCHHAPSVVIVGAGPSGLFAALRALEVGLRPIIVERGKAVEQRRLDIAQIARRHQVDATSNWCFGEGGAGTFSDGKLYTRSTKRGNVSDVIEKFIEHGGDPSLRIDAHAHIGTDRLPAIIANMRRTIEAHGGEYHFSHTVTSLIIKNGEVRGVKTQEGASFEGVGVVLATGHSARNIYHLFHQSGWLVEPKAFALGVRVEHPQQLIDNIQYHGSTHSPLLPPATYSLTAHVADRAVFSFCMCPGGVIVPAATAPGQQVVNGMSNAARNSGYANSGIAVEVRPSDVRDNSPLALMHFQEAVEQRFYQAANLSVDAPTQRLVDFLSQRESATLPRTNYVGHTIAAPLHNLLPSFVADALRQAFPLFDKKMHGFVTNQATLLGVESRTSSPVRIPRNPITLQHPQLPRLYPCGEGAGYAGGIVSSAIDGMRCIDALVSLQR
ncbi:MAG: FAD-binding protein [Bacteroidales bacterium]|nr:FAD-binding protein [Bacteroidales bacterium]